MLDSVLGLDGRWPEAIAALLVAAGLAYVVAELAARATRALFLTVTGEQSAGVLRGPIVRRPIRLTRAAVFLVAFAGLVVPALDAAGARIPNGVVNASRLSDWLVGSGVRIFIIVLLAYLLMRFVALACHRLEESITLESSPDGLELVKRARTLSRLIQNALTTIVMVLSVLMVLRELQIDIMPVLTGAGILGLAVGFGAQTLVKDLISGFFMILENQVRVGDVVEINGTGGLVEAINLRTVVLRDLEGVVHIFPNGSVATLANRTKDFAYYVVDMGVAYKEDTDRVVEVLREVGTDLGRDPQFSPSILEPLEILGVDDFGDSQVTIKIRIKTVPLKQWEVGRELRRRIKRRFDAEGIEIPFPHMSVYFGEASKPFAYRAVS